MSGYEPMAISQLQVEIGDLRSDALHYRRERNDTLEVLKQQLADNLRLQEEIKVLRERSEQLSVALAEAECFVADELQVRKASMLPDPIGEDAAYVESTQAVLDCIRLAMHPHSPSSPKGREI